MKILGIMPARSGSKELKNKNLRKLNGKPLIFYTLNTLLKLKNIVYPFVSTDSKLILNYSKRFGLKQNYLRPKKLSTGKSNVVDAVLHAIRWFEKKEIFFDYILLLEPTSPKRDFKYLKKVINKVTSKNILSSASICRLQTHPFETVHVNNKKWSYLKKSKKKTFRRQDFDQNYYFIDGNFYLCKTNFIKKYKNFIKENMTRLFINNLNYPIDINNDLDLKIAEVIMKHDKS